MYNFYLKDVGLLKKADVPNEKTDRSILFFEPQELKKERAAVADALGLY